MPFKNNIAERNLALIDLDMDYARKLMPTAGSDQIRLVALHKARYETIGIGDKFRLESGDWLRKHGYKRMTGSPVLPKGQLPE